MKGSRRSSEVRKTNVSVDANVLLDVLVPRENKLLTIDSGQFPDWYFVRR